MGLDAIFDIASSGMQAETARLTTTANNMTNANTVSSTVDDVYKAQYPVFKTIQQEASQWMGDTVKNGVAVTGVIESKDDPIKNFDPSNPMADAKGFVYAPNINYVEEMANMISATRSYHMNVEMLSNTKQLMQRTLHLGE
jgi:flagellar basal-body rod protein FlgC